ncbi:MAG: ABC transporter permease, partial [Negativicutes bacterium]|nr:ABC transporter permease [Negativicutes bacterium]
MVAAMIVYTIGAFFFGGWQLTWVGFAGLLLGSAIFAALGSIAGMIVEGNDGLSVIQNFFMTPMIFFSGSFFPIKNLPWGIDQVVRLLPLGMINQLLHARTFGMEQVYFLVGLSIMAIVCWGWGTHVIRNYQE